MELVWDQAGERRFETGIDRGVLFLPEGSAVPWNGITNMTESLGREVKSYYVDGVKYLDHQVIAAFQGTLQALTYPDEMEELTGTVPFAPGVFVHDQRSKAFHLCYRTLVGNDLDGADHGYKLHILYNVLATPGNLQYASLGSIVNAQVFQWTLNAIPPQIFGIRPTSHVSLHTRSLDPALLTQLEELLYGTEETDPELPDLPDLLNMVEVFYTP